MVEVLGLSAVEVSVLGRRSRGCLERLREGVEEYEYVDVEGERCRLEEPLCLVVLERFR